MAAAVEELLALMAERDPFALDPRELHGAQLKAIGERLEERRAQIRVLDQRARDAGIGSIGSLQDVIPLLFAHQTYKSYPDAFVAKGRWDGMNQWLDTLSTNRVRVDVGGVSDIDEWMDRLHAAGHFVFGTSGTTGKSSFLNQTATDRKRTRASQVAYITWVTGVEPRADRPVFILAPRKSFTGYGDFFSAVTEGFGRPDAVWFLSEEPLRATDMNRMGAMRKAIAEGTVTPGEIASFEAEAGARAQRMNDALMGLVDQILAHRHEPMMIMGLWAQHFAIVEEARRRGVGPGEFHPETVLIVGGGTKGAALPPDYREQVQAFIGLDASRFYHVYGMQEMTTAGCPKCLAGRYHVPPWLVLLLLDQTGERLLNAESGSVEGRMAFFDLAVDGRWGGLISGDKVEVDFSPCACGRPGPTIGDQIVRYNDLPEGDDKLTCSGTISGYVRGLIDV